MSNINFLRFILVTSLITVLALISFSLFFLNPNFSTILINDAESEAIIIGRHLAAVFQQEEKVTEKLPPGFDMVRRAADDFGLMKIKVFSPEGKIVYSSSKEDIGEINERDYFHNIVARGKVFTKVAYNHTKTMEDKVVSSDVVETYVPIMNGEHFAGAFELYLDITDIKQELDDLLFSSNILLLLISVGLLAAMLVISIIARRSFVKQEEGERKIIRQSLDLQERNTELAVLNDIAHELGKTIDLEVLLPRILETIVNRLPVLQLEKKGGIMLIDDEKMKLVAHLGHDESFLKDHEDLTVRDCLCGLAARTGEIIISTDSQKDERHTICYGHMTPHGHIIIPLKAANRVIGILYLYLPADVEFEEYRVELLESMAAQMGLAIDNAMLYDETKKMACYDSLTGLANRRLVGINMQQAISQAKRYKKPFCVAMLDIDYFKKYNDAMGHDAGDRLLAMVADKISQGVREVDLAARYGGEEFLLIMFDSDLDGACLAVERIRQDIEAGLDVTISAGVVEYDKDISEKELIIKADEALYRAKEKGRNRVECA